jgi:hypothetical protein
VVGGGGGTVFTGGTTDADAVNEELDGGTGVVSVVMEEEGKPGVGLLSFTLPHGGLGLLLALSSFICATASSAAVVAVVEVSSIIVRASLMRLSTRKRTPRFYNIIVHHHHHHFSNT